MDMLENEDEAIAVWKQLLRKGAKKIAFGECGEGIRHTESLLNDARYRIGRSYFDLGNRRMAEKYLQDHIQHRKPGLPSTYSRREVLKKLREAQST